MQNKDARGAMTNELAKKLNADTNNDSKKAVPGEEQATGAKILSFLFARSPCVPNVHGITHIVYHGMCCHLPAFSHLFYPVKDNGKFTPLSYRVTS